MMSFNTLAIAVVLCATVAAGAVRHLHLDDKYMVNVETTGEADDAKISLELIVTTTGFVGFGFGPNPTMEGADLFIGGVDSNNVPYYADYIGTGHVVPTNDTVQDWTLISGTEKDGITTLKIERKLDTKDPNNQDIKIENSDINVLWSIGEKDDIEHHATRGVRSLNLMTQDDNSGSGISAVSVGVLLIGLAATLFQS